MQNIVRILIAAILLLILKAMFLDDYIKQYQNEHNASVESSVSEPAAPVSSEPVASARSESHLRDANETNASGIHSEEDFEKAAGKGLFDRFVDWLAEKLAKKVPPPAEL